jgi:hypothetical protein
VATKDIDITARLDEIAALIKKGADPERFQEEIDQLLGTTMEDRDPQLEAAWEDGYQRRRS